MLTAGGNRTRSRAGGQPDDAGQLILLIVFFTLVAATMILAAVDASTVFLARRALANAADGAALAGAQGVDRAELYAAPAGQSPGCLPLDPVGVSAAVTRYLSTTDLPADVSAAASVSAGGRTVSVVLSRRVPLPFGWLVGAVNARWAHGVPVTATATASSPLLASNAAISTRC